MEPSPRDSYLEMEVITATPQKRQLMLITAAIRLIDKTREHWQAGQNGKGFACLVRAQQIITELLSALDHGVDPPLTRRVAALYLFVFRRLVDASLDHDEKKLDEALAVLEPQREAWQGVCEQLGGTTAGGRAGLQPASQQPAAQPALADSAGDGQLSDQPPAGISLEA